MKRWKFWLCGLLAALIIFRALLPAILKREVNKKLAAVPDYTAHVDGVSLALWRGAFSLKKIEFQHHDGGMGLTIAELNTRIRWLPLLHGRVVGTLDVESPRLRILAKKPVAAVKKAKEKTAQAKDVVEEKTGQSIPDLLASLIPFRVDALTVHHGSVRFRSEGEDIRRQSKMDQATPQGGGRDDEKEPGLEARVTEIEIAVKNLTNTRQMSETLTATGEASAYIMDKTPIKLAFRMNPISKVPEFYLRIDLQELPLSNLNAVLDWQWGVLVDRGTFTLFSESVAKEGGFKGYVRPLVHDLKIGHKERKGPLQTMKESALKVVSHILKNNETRIIGTQVPFEGRFENPSVGIWTAVIEVLRNAFIQALRADFDPTFKTAVQRT